jgi:hypothetical protein
MGLAITNALFGIVRHPGTLGLLVLFSCSLAGGCQGDAYKNPLSETSGSFAQSNGDTPEERSAQVETKEERQDIAPETDDENYPLEITIEEEGIQRRDRISFKVTVRNKSKEAIGWDREFSTFVHWWVRADNDEYLLEPKTIVSKIDQTKDSLAKTRFISIQPGKTVTKTFVLTKPFRAFRISAWGGSPESRHPSHFEGYESLEQYSIGAKVKKVSVELVYGPGTQGRMAFKALFGFDSDEVRLWNRGNFRSNQVVLTFK